MNSCLLTTKWVTSVMLLGLVFATNGCLNISARLQPIDETVKDRYTGNDCVPIILGFGAGTVTIEQAMENGQLTFAPNYLLASKRTKITKVRSVELNDSAFLILGFRCIEVKGE